MSIPSQAVSAPAAATAEQQLRRDFHHLRSNWWWFLLFGVIVYRHFPQGALWVIGLLVGIEMVMQGWTWIMLSLAIRNIPAEPA